MSGELRGDEYLLVLIQIPPPVLEKASIHYLLSSFSARWKCSVHELTVILTCKACCVSFGTSQVCEHKMHCEMKAHLCVPNAQMEQSTPHGAVHAQPIMTHNLYAFMTGYDSNMDANGRAWTRRCKISLRSQSQVLSRQLSRSCVHLAWWIWNKLAFRTAHIVD